MYVRSKIHHPEQVIKEEQSREQYDHCNGHCNIHRLRYSIVHLLFLIRPHQICNDCCHRKQYAVDACGNRRPETGPYGNSCKVFDTCTAGHHRIDHIHGIKEYLGDEYGP